MSRKSKAKTSEGSNKASKKMKVSEDPEDGVVMEEVDDHEGPWDGIRVIGKDEEVLCRFDGCGAKATATWVCNKTGDQWDMCDKCQLEDFGEVFTGAGTDTEPGTSTDMPPPQPMHEGKNEEAPVDPVDADTDDPREHLSEGKVGKTTGDSKMEDNQSREDDSSPPTNPILDGVTATDKAPPIVPEDFSSPSESPSIASSSDIGTGGEHDFPPLASEVSNAAPAITQTQDDILIVDGNQGREDAVDDDDEDEGQYDLKKIMPLEDLLKDDTICCSQEDCGGLPAFGLYVNSKNPKDRWYYCLDCQEEDFDGWPPVKDLPVTYLEPEHLRVIARKCSSRKNPPMPVFPSSDSVSPKGKPNNTDAATANFVTPPPNSLGFKENAGGAPPKANTAGKAKALEAHKKWLEAAQAVGGKDARIVVSKPAAKKLIFDFMYDAFRPMNITQIFKVRHAFRLAAVKQRVFFFLIISIVNVL